MGRRLSGPFQLGVVEQNTVCEAPRRIMKPLLCVCRELQTHSQGLLLPWRDTPSSPSPRTVEWSAAETGFQLGKAEGDGLGARQMVPETTGTSLSPDSVKPVKSEPTRTSTVPLIRESVSTVASFR